MRFAVFFSLFVTATLAMGCSQKKYEASVLLVVRESEAEARKKPIILDGFASIDLHTRMKVMKSDSVWSTYVAPRLKRELSSKEKVRESLRIVRGARYEETELVHLAEVTVSVIGRSDDDIESVVEGMLAGLESWSARYSPKYAPYVRRTKKA